MSAAVQELRLALVMNGGVSLAVWMAGVTHELNQCRTAGTTTTSTAAVWQRILDQAGYRVVIDLVAGASAGGLNGTVLADAIACGKDLPDLQQLWEQRAALIARNLINPDPQPRTSLLDGRYFEDEIRALLDTGTRRTENATDCSLLVTATALLPLTDQNDPSAKRDSRRVYRFVRQAGTEDTTGVDDFSEFPNALVRAARASASFPGAFQPVMETPELQARRKDFELDLDSPLSYLMDGGVLDNTPFEPILDELRSRPISGRFERVLLYINPGVPRPTAPVPADGPDAFKTLTATLAAFRETDRRLDEERLGNIKQAEHFDEIRPHRLLDRLIDQEPTDPLVKSMADLAAAAFGQYQRTTRLRIAMQLKVDPASPLIDKLLVNDVDQIDPWPWGLGAAERVLRWLGRVVNQRAGADAVAFGPLTDSQLRIAGAMRDLTELVRKTTPENRLAKIIDHADAAFCGEVATVVRSAADAVAQALGTSHSGEDLIRLAIMVEVATGLFAWKIDDSDIPTFIQTTITPSAQPPIDALHPLLASGDWPRTKLYGTLWGNFGAFASRNGRRWDWLWGRLDATMVLTDELFKRGRFTEREKTRFREELVDAILRDVGSLDASGQSSSTLDRDLIVRQARENIGLNGRLLDLYRSEIAGVDGQETRTALYLIVERVLAQAVGSIPKRDGRAPRVAQIADPSAEISGNWFERKLTARARQWYQARLVKAVEKFLEPRVSR
jgi:predicted acylesterase/phospholipase RssA